MKYITAVVLSLILMSFSSLQQQDYTVNDPEAEKLIKDVSAKFKSYKNIKADFSLTIKEPEGDWIDEKIGIVHLEGDKFKIEMDEYKITCDGKTSWMYSPASNEVQISYFELEEDMFTPSQIFDIYSEKYNFRVKSKSGDQVTIELTPIDKEQSFFKIDMLILTSKKEIVSCKIYEKSGMRYLYTLSNLDTNLELQDAFFVFDSSIYPEIEIIDLR
ncbi:MAG: outer membrane lipoprotein carrier protein LolA [Chitinophagales bacterium]|nr:outer membrane lipoprotein carrier protein LolA [Chitinophagales bacterium]